MVLEHSQGILGLEGSFGLCSLINQQKGLVQVVRKLFLLAEHRNCLRHIYANLKKKYKHKILRALVWKVAKLTTIPEFQLVMGHIKALNVDAYNSLNQISP